MLNKRTLHVIIIILALSNISVIAFMFCNRPPKPPRNPKAIIETTLNLSDEQKTSFEALIPAHRKAMGEQRERIVQLKKELMMTLVDKDLFALKEELVSELGNALIQMDLLQLNHLQSIYDLCTDEQKQSFEALIIELETFIPHPPRNKKQF